MPNIEDFTTWYCFGDQWMNLLKTDTSPICLSSIFEVALQFLHHHVQVLEFGVVPDDEASALLWAIQVSSALTGTCICSFLFPWQTVQLALAAADWVEQHYVLECKQKLLQSTAFRLNSLSRIHNRTHSIVPMFIQRWNVAGECVSVSTLILVVGISLHTWCQKWDDG